MLKLPTILLLLLSFSLQAFAEEVNIYSYRQPHLIKPLLDEWSRRTGIKTNFLYIKDGIAERLQFEGRRSPADLLLTADIYRLADLKDKGLTQEVVSPIIETAIPAALRDTENHWFGLTVRARVIYASNNARRAPVNEVLGYADLARADLGKRVCTRPLSHIYNLGLTASLLAQQGEKGTIDWLRGLKNNLARRPQGNDRTQIKAIEQTLCDYALGNSYYFGLLVNSEPRWTQGIRIIMPRANKGGTHINISGMALARYASHPMTARQLMEFLVSEYAQDYYAATNYEFPARPGVGFSPFLQKNFGNFDRQHLALTTTVKFTAEAQTLIERIGIDN